MFVVVHFPYCYIKGFAKHFILKLWRFGAETWELPLKSLKKPRSEIFYTLFEHNLLHTILNHFIYFQNTLFPPQKCSMPPCFEWINPLCNRLRLERSKHVNFNFDYLRVRYAFGSTRFNLNFEYIGIMRQHSAHLHITWPPNSGQHYTASTAIWTNHRYSLSNWLYILLILLTIALLFCLVYVNAFQISVKYLVYHIIMTKWGVLSISRAQYMWVNIEFDCPLCIYFIHRGKNLNPIRISHFPFICWWKQMWITFWD